MDNQLQAFVDTLQVGPALLADILSNLPYAFVLSFAFVVCITAVVVICSLIYSLLAEDKEEDDNDL